MHYHVTNAQFLVAGFLLILAIALAVSAFRKNRRDKLPPFLNYFGSQYDRADPQGDSLSEADSRYSDRYSRFDAFGVPDFDDARRRSRTSDDTRRDREWN